MIGFTSDYFLPENIEEAYNTFLRLEHDEKSPMYITGGTEFLTLARLNEVYAGAIVDLSAIPELHVFHLQNKSLVTGAALPLTNVVRSKKFPLLAATAGRIADHTARNSITVGGNLCGQIPYRETVLPFLVTNSSVIIAKNGELEEVALMDIFKERMHLAHGAFVVQLKTPASEISTPFFSVKRRKLDKIDYPLLTLAAVRKGGNIRLAISGLCPFPFRSSDVESVINNQRMSLRERIINVKDVLPGVVVNDWIASADYRIFVLEHTLLEMFHVLSGEERD